MGKHQGKAFLLGVYLSFLPLKSLHSHIQGFSKMRKAPGGIDQIHQIGFPRQRVQTGFAPLPALSATPLGPEEKATGCGDAASQIIAAEIQ